MNGGEIFKLSGINHDEPLTGVDDNAIGFSDFEDVDRDHWERLRFFAGRECRKHGKKQDNQQKRGKDSVVSGVHDRHLLSCFLQTYCLEKRRA